MRDRIYLKVKDTTAGLVGEIRGRDTVYMWSAGFTKDELRKWARRQIPIVKSRLAKEQVAQ